MGNSCCPDEPYDADGSSVDDYYQAIEDSMEPNMVMGMGMAPQPVEAMRGMQPDRPQYIRRPRPRYHMHRQYPPQTPMSPHLMHQPIDIPIQRMPVSPTPTPLGRFRSEMSLAPTPIPMDGRAWPSYPALNSYGDDDRPQRRDHSKSSRKARKYRPGVPGYYTDIIRGGATVSDHSSRDF